jgi:hypothetical protein
MREVPLRFFFMPLLKLRRLLLPAFTTGSLVIGTGCGGEASKTPAAQRTCAITLPERAQPTMTAPPLGETSFAAPGSTIVVHSEIPVALIQRELEAKVQHRVAEDRDHDIGVAGRLEYTADRGPFRVSVKGDALFVATTIDIHARACAKGSCYAGCDPRAEVLAKVPLRIGADYKFRNPAVSIKLSRGCEISALGGFAKIDVTNELASQLQAQAPRIEQQIRAQLPDLRPETERMWKDLLAPRPLAMGSCIRVLPEGLVQGPPGGEGDHVLLSFGLLARPELQTRCSTEPARTTPLPPLRDDPALPREGLVYLAVVMPPEAAAASLETGNFQVGNAHAHVSHAEGGTQLGMSMQLTGEVCGTVAFQAPGAAWLPDGRSVHLARSLLLPGEKERVAAAHADPAALLAGIETLPIPVPISAADLASTIPDLAKAESSTKVDVSASIASSSPDGAGLRHPGELVAVTRITGAVTLRAK